MEPMEAKLIELAITNGAYVLIVGIALFLIKSMIKFYLDQDTEKYKSELNKQLEQTKTELTRENFALTHDLDQKMETYKSNLEVLKQEYQIQFSHLHLERANVIKDLYEKLVELHSATVIFTRTMHGVVNDAEKEAEDRINRVSQAFHDFKNFYIPKKLYFSKTVVAQLDEIMVEYWSKADDFARTQQLFKSRSLSKEAYEHSLKELNTISDVVAKEFPAMIEQIEDEFRNILGVKN